MTPEGHPGARVAPKGHAVSAAPAGRVSSSLVPRGLIEVEEVEEVADLLVGLGRMSHRDVPRGVERRRASD